LSLPIGGKYQSWYDKHLTPPSWDNISISESNTRRAAASRPFVEITAHELTQRVGENAKGTQHSLTAGRLTLIGRS